MIKQYWTLSKPGIVAGNLMTAVAGYLFASHMTFVMTNFVFSMLGFVCVIAASSVVNNLYDRDIDKLMVRTQARPTVREAISLKNGAIYSLVLAVLGFGLLAVFANITTVILGFLGFGIYAAVYTPLKRKTYHATFIGGFAGAMPIMGGYTAFSGRLDIEAIVLGMMMLMWQLPHFYALAVLHAKDYARAKIPTILVVLGQRATIGFMLFYTFMFILFNALLYRYIFYPRIYIVTTTCLCLVWLWFSMQGLLTKPAKNWARSSFLMSLVVLVFMSVFIGLY